MTVGTDTWVTLDYANDYIDNLYGEANWPLLSDPNKEKLLITAFRRLKNKFGIAALSTATAVKDAQVITALFIINNFEDLKKREALQAMGVKSFTIAGFSETYTAADEYFIPPEAEALLSDYTSEVVIGIERELDD
jgi:hypothetical protein